MESDSDINKIVQRWAMNKFYSTKTMKYMKNWFNDLEIDVIWTYVEFNTGKPIYKETIGNTPKAEDSREKSELCSYIFKNETHEDQEHTLTVEHTKTFKSVVKTTDSSTFKKKVDLRLGFPRAVANTFCGAEFGQEMLISSEDETAKEKTIKSHIDTTIKVPKQSMVTAKLIEKKNEFRGTFHLPVFMSGQVPISIRRKGKKPEFLHHCEGSIYNIMREQPQYAGFALNSDDQSVKYWIHGSCEFEEGMDLTFELSQDKLLGHERVDTSEDQLLEQEGVELNEQSKVEQ